MPIHDWSQVPTGLFHHFHQVWSTEIAHALNRGLLPVGLAALVEQRAGVKEPDVLAIETFGGLSNRPATSLDDLSGGVAMVEEPKTMLVQRSSEEIYAQRANQIVIRHHLGEIVAILEIVSPGNKDKRMSILSFVEKSVDFIRAGIHVLIVDLFPPTPRDPQSVHQLIWNEIDEGQTFNMPAGKDRLLVSYQSGAEKVAYIEPFSLEQSMPDMPLFLTSRLHIKVPLQSTYQTTWETLPKALKDVVEAGRLPSG